MLSQKSPKSNLTQSKTRQENGSASLVKQFFNLGRILAWQKTQNMGVDVAGKLGKFGLNSPKKSDQPKRTQNLAGSNRTDSKSTESLKKSFHGRQASDKNSSSKSESLKKLKKNEASHQFVIFRPKESDLLKTQIKDKINQTPAKFLHRGQKNLSQILTQNKTDSWQIWTQNINLAFKKIKILANPNRLLGLSLSITLAIFLIYISFFDIHFLIKNYQVTFSPGSYLGKNERQLILDKFSQTKILGVFPVNQFWFVNDRNLTLLSQNVVPEVLGVQITSRNWPNKISIQITTAPILLTLKVVENGQGKWWRVLNDGRILTQDEAGLQENLVIVERPINFDQQSFTLQNYPIFNDTSQLNRLYFTVNLWGWLKELNLEVAQTILPSLNMADKDVSIILQNGTKLFFDSARFSAQSQKDRLQSLFESQVLNQLKADQLAYLDFRISKKVFVCPRGQICEKESLQVNQKPPTEPAKTDRP